MHLCAAWQFRLSIVFVWLMGGCFRIKPSAGGGEGVQPTTRTIDPNDVALEDGYVIDTVTRDLTYPTQVTFDAQGRVYVVEAGYSYGESFTEPRLLRVDGPTRHTVVAQGENPPWTGAVFHDGGFYVAEGGGRIVRVTMEGKIEPLVTDLPSMGDHHTNGPALGPDGKLYFSQGAITNSGVVGTDSHDFGWLERKPQLHDVPCRDISVSGQNFETENPLTPEKNDKVSTGAFMPFGTPSSEGQVIAAQVPCTGAVFSVPASGGELELVAWGFRNPYGLAFAADGELYVTENAFDDRGSRPIFGAPDVLWKVESGRWYGFPDYAGGRPVANEDYQVPGKEAPRALLAAPPGEPPQPVARLAVHSSSSGFDFSRSEVFGHEGEAFIAQFGDMAPSVGKVWSPVGFKVVRVEPDTGVIHDFAVNEGGTNGPASALGRGGLERPVAARFDTAGSALYVVDFGVMRMDERAPRPQQRTGVLWRIRRAAHAGGESP
jgi:glucose/arabinose dehydrogenase